MLDSVNTFLKKRFFFHFVDICATSTLVLGMHTTTAERLQITLQKLIAAAELDQKQSRWHEGKAKLGRFEVRVCGVGRPSIGDAGSNRAIRRDFYVDGKRTSREKFTVLFQTAGDEA
jgi:hypothetical protein